MDSKHCFMVFWELKVGMMIETSGVFSFSTEASSLAHAENLFMNLLSKIE
jgi:hypothetical protein